MAFERAFVFFFILDAVDASTSSMDVWAANYGASTSREFIGADPLEVAAFHLNDKYDIFRVWLGFVNDFISSKTQPVPPVEIPTFFRNGDASDGVSRS